VVIADRISEPMKHPAETAKGRARRAGK
jgi:hypothetical protein